MIDLKSVVEKYPECLDSATKFKSYMMDLYPDNSNKAHIRILADIVDCGIALEIKNGKTDSISISIFCNTMENQYGYSAKLVEECVNQFLVALGFDSNMNSVDNCEEKTEAVKNLIEVGDKIKYICNLDDFDIEEETLCKYCGNDQYVSVPDGVEIIDVDAFCDCEEIIAISIPDSVTCIETRAFSGCWSLETINIPNKVAYIGRDAFEYCTNLNCFIVDSDNEFYSSIDGVLFNKEKTELLYYPANKLENKYYIPNSVSEISYGAFSSCNNLKGITIPESVTSIDRQAFSSWSIEAIYFYNEEQKIKFKDCFSLSYRLIVKQNNIETAINSIQADNKITIVEKENYTYVCNLDDFDIRNGILHEYYGVDQYVAIPSGVTNIGKKAFSNHNIISVLIPDSVKHIEQEAFSSCHKLTCISIPNGVTSIGNNAFELADKLEHIFIPGSIIDIGERAFWRCEELSSITVSDDNKYFSSVEGVLFNKAKTKLIQYPAKKSNEIFVIPDGVITIGSFAFDSCQILTNLTLPNSISQIEEGAFMWCSSLEKINIPNSVKKIGESAFNFCRSLTEITFSCNTTHIGEDIFKACYNLETIYFQNEKMKNDFSDSRHIYGIDWDDEVNFVVKKERD